jgi:hypothetical protein
MTLSPTMPSLTRPFSKTPSRFVGVAALLFLVAGCAGAPDRANDVQNLNGISDDISAVRMTQSDSLKIPDPNLATTYPKSYQLPHE